MTEIRIVTIGGVYESESFSFSGGEVQVRIPNLPEAVVGDIQVTARLQSSDAVLRLLQVCEILDRVHRGGGSRTLAIPYFPCARQDRVTKHDTAFSLKPMARLINGLRFDRVVVCDPHSDVTPALLERVEVIPQLDLMRRHPEFREMAGSLVIVAPDAGAAKKGLAAARHYGTPFVTASKSRDVATGLTTRTRLDEPDAVAGQACLIADDICDGGRTFIELAKALRQSGAERVLLYVTHGIFSQGLTVFEGLIDAVFTTDAFIPANGWPASSDVPLRIAPIHLYRETV